MAPTPSAKSHPAPGSHRWGALWMELPLLAGIASGWMALWLRGSLFVLDGSVAGYHWPEWLHNAWHVAHGRWDRMSGFRKPLHGYFVGMLGESIGYADAAILVSSLSGALCIVAAALLARVLGGPAAGGLAAITLGMVPLLANASHWGTGYPLLAATTGWALAASTLFAARPSHGTLLLAALSTIMALASEDRGMLVLPWVAGMTFWAWRTPSRPHGGWWVLAALAILVTPPTIDHVLGHRAPFALSAESKRLAQQEVVLRWLRIEPAPELVKTCARIQAPDTLTASFFQTPCARAVLHYNSTEIAPKAAFFSASALLLALPMWVLGGARRRRKLVWTGLALGGLSWGVFAAATPMPHRYILQFVVPISVVVPVAIGRLVGLLGSRLAVWVAGLAACATAGLYHGWSDPHDRNGTWQQVRGNWSEPTWSAETEAIRARVPPDEAVLDCADHGINSALLPDNVIGPAPFLSPDAGFCRDWVTDTTRFGAARRWVVVSKVEGLFDSGQKRTLHIDRIVADTPGWERVTQLAAVELWVRGP